MTTRRKILVFSGIDGSGKTTLAKMLIRDLESHGYRVRYCWCRHESLVTSALVKVLKKISTAEVEHSIEEHEYTHLKRGIFRFAIFRVAYELFVLVDYALEVHNKMKKLRRPYDVVVIDRYYLDVAADVIAECDLGYNDARRFQGALARFVPKPAATFLFTVPVQVSLERKNDIVSREYIVRRLNAYKVLSSSTTLDVIDGTMSIDSALSEVEKRLAYVVQFDRQVREAECGRD